MLIFACFSILGFQIAYLLLFLYQFQKERKKKPPVPVQSVSIIICAHNEEQNLRALIPLLLEQNHPSFEIVVVEDRCHDGTLDYLMEVAREHPQVRVVRVLQQPNHVNGKKFGLTLGIKAARYGCLLFTDADCRPRSIEWITRMGEHFDGDLQIVLGFSAYRKTSGLLNSFIRFETFLTGMQYVALAWSGMPYMGVGRNLAYRKSLFLNNKGYHNHLDVTGGDDDLFVNRHATKLNTGISIGEDALVYSFPKTTVKEFYVQKLRHLSAGKRYTFLTKVVLGLFSGSWIATWFFVLPAGILTHHFYWIAGVFGVRWIIMIFLFHMASRKLGDPFEAWKAPFLDFIYAFYYLVAGTVALLSKKVRWKI